MHFETSTWIFSVIGIGLLTMSGTTVVDISGPLTATVGQNVSFMWTSNRSILTAAWGIRSDNLPDPQYIFVDNSEVAVVSVGLEEKLKKRLQYVGNLADGKAWFNISYATVNDSNTYIVRIRESGSSTTNPYYAVLNVSKPAPVITPSPSTPPVSFSPSSTPTSSSAPTTPTTPPKEKLKDWVIAVIVLSVIIVLVAATLISCYCCCPEYLKKCWNRFCCCCPCKMEVKGSSEGQESELKSKPPSAEK